MLHLKLIEKQEQAEPKANKRREIIKNKAEINNKEIPPKIQKKINRTKRCVFKT
jgi:hypothetical protein